MTEPLNGFVVGVTAARRSEELAHLLERRGAEVLSAPALRIVPLADDSELLAATHACIAPDRCAIDVVPPTRLCPFAARSPSFRDRMVRPRITEFQA